MNQDALTMPLNKFLRKYSNAKSNALQSNDLLKFWYKSINKGNRIDVSQNLGIKNDKDGAYSDFANNNSNDNSLNEFFTFIGSNAKGSYMMETGRYSDSPISFMVEVPAHKLSTFGEFKNGKFEFNYKQAPFFNHVANTYNSLLSPEDRLSKKELKQELERTIDREINEFMRNNSTAFKDAKIMARFVDANGNLNQDGKTAVASYVVNSFINGVQFNQAFLPDVSRKNSVKRAKGLRSPGFSMKNVFFEPIYFKDDVVNGITLDDGAMYILEEDAQRIEKAFGDVMPVGKGYKFVHAGMEQNNKNFKGKNFFNKGYTTILNEEYVKDNPSLRGLYNAMKARRQKYIDKHGAIEDSITSGKPTYMNIAIPMSANKIKNAEGENNLGPEFKQDGAFTLEDFFNNGADLDSNLNKVLDGMYWNGDKYMGMDGSNLLLQQKMDQVRYDVNTPVQMMKAITTNGLINGNMAELEEIQKMLSDLESEQVADTLKMLEKGSSKEVLAFFKEIIGMDSKNGDSSSIDVLQKYLLKDGLSINTPVLRQIAINTFLNRIRQQGNKLRTPGTIAQQKPARYQKRVVVNGKEYKVSTGGSRGLQFYRQNVDGSHRPGEAIVPAYLKGKLQARQYRIFQESKNSSLIDYDNTNYANIEYKHPSAAVAYAQGVLKEAKGLGRVPQEMTIQEFMTYNKVVDNKNRVIGFYIPGETFQATRVPAHGPQSTGFFEAIGYDTTGGSQVQLPSEFALKVTGGDYDGDQVFMQYKSKDTAKWNDIFDKMKSHWLSKEMANEVKLPIDFEEEVKQDIAKIKKNIPGLADKKSAKLMFTPEHRRKAFDDTLVSKNNVGAAANYHSYLRMLASYGTELKKPITIDGQTRSVLEDVKGESRTIGSAKILNIILDNASHAFADDLGINRNTIGDAMIMVNLGFSLEQVGTILNSDIYLEHNRIADGKRNTFAANESADTVKSSGNININTKNINDPSNEDSIHSLIAYVSKIKSDVSDISSIMGGHNKIESDPFILSQQIENLELLLNNAKADQQLNIKESFAKNPMLQNYLKVAKKALAIQERFDPVSRPDYKEVYGSVTTNTTRNLNNNQKRKVHEDLERVATSRLLGLNNISQQYKNDLINPKNPNNIFQRMEMVVDKMKSNVVSGKKLGELVSEYDSSLLFSKALSFSNGNRPYISLKSSFFNENLTDLERDLVRQEFNALPPTFKKDLMIYDLMTNGWKGRKSLFHLMDDSFTKEVSKLSDRDMKVKDFVSMNDAVKLEMEAAVAELNPEMYDSTATPLFRDGKLNYSIFGSKEGTPNNRIWQKIKKGEPVTFIYNKETKNSTPQKRVFEKFFIKLDGLGTKQLKVLQDSKLNPDSNAYFNLVQKIMPNVRLSSKKIRDNYKGDVNYDRITSIADETTEISNDPFKVKTPANSKEIAQDFSYWANLGSSNSDTNFRLKKNWTENTGDLTREQFDDMMEYEDFISETDKKAMYSAYNKERKEAKKVNQKINEQTVKDMTDEELMDHFETYGNMNQYSYSNVLEPLVFEIAQRISRDQTENYTGVLSDGKDISLTQKWLMSNNIPSNHPMTQGLVRQMQNNLKDFHKEKSNYMGRLNQATNELYKEQLGYLVSGGTFKDRVKALWDYFFKNKEQLYTQLYGPLMTHDFVEKLDREGKPYQMKIMKYKPIEDIKKGLEAGTITEAQYNFYLTTKEMADDLGQYGEYGEKGLRADYIPHVQAGQMEAFSRRGLLGLMMSTKTLDERIKDVRMDAINPNTGEMMKNVSFNDIDFMYSLAMSENKPNVSAADYYKYKVKATKLLKSGKNQDGTPIELSSIDMGTAIGNTFMNRFTNSASQKSNHFPSMDLNKAFADYIHTSLFTNGNANVAGMKSMLPAIDGVILSLKGEGRDNMKAYVEKVWRENFLKGAKQDKLKTPAELAALGISSDKVVDFITRGSLIYWLGYKGLVIGGGLYAIGNVLNGKFNNIAHAGGKSWLQGERRFWLGRSGKFELTDPFKGVRESNEILKKLGYMDINLYDDVSINKENSFGNAFMNLALLPMTKSEKWIQGTHLLGLLTDDEWNMILSDNKNPISSERMNELENKVKLSHGKGYQPTDQRMIQLYSWGRMMMQFSRHIPTVIYNNFAKKDIDNYGNVHVGAYRQVYDTIQGVVRGDIKPKEFSTYYKNLSDEERRKFNSGLAGFGILTAAGALGTFGADNKYVNDLASDVNIFFDTERLGYKLTTPPALGMIGKFVN